MAKKKKYTQLAADDPYDIFNKKIQQQGANKVINDIQSQKIKEKEAKYKQQELVKSNSNITTDQWQKTGIGTFNAQQNAKKSSSTFNPQTYINRAKTDAIRPKLAPPTIKATNETTLPGIDTQNPLRGIGRNLIQTYKSDSPIETIGKGIVNYGAGTALNLLSVPSAVIDTGVVNFRNMLDRKPIEQIKPRSFTEDIITPRMKQGLNNMGIAGEIIKPGLDMGFDPLTYYGGGLVDQASHAGLIGKASQLGTTERLLNEATLGRKILKTPKSNTPISMFESPIKTETPMSSYEDIIRESTPKLGSKTLPGKFNLINRPLQKAETELNNAIETVQNKYGTNKFTTAEQARFKAETELDFPRLIRNVEEARANPYASSERLGLKRAAGIISPGEEKVFNSLKVTPRKNIFPGKVDAGTKIITPNGEGVLTGNRLLGKIGVEHPDGRITYYNPNELPSITGSRSVNPTLKPINTTSPAIDTPAVNAASSVDDVAKSFSSTKAIKGKPTGIALPDDEAGLVKIINNMQREKSGGVKINLQLFAEAQAKLEAIRKSRGFMKNSLLNSSIIPEEMKVNFRDNMSTYEPITNKDTWNKALDRVTSDIDTSLSEWRSLRDVKTADDTALGQALIFDSIKKGDIRTANEISYELADRLTTAGQTVQAASILKRLTPEGMLTYVQRNLQNAEKELGDGFKGKLKLTDEEASIIQERMNNIQNLPEGRAKDIEFAQIQKLIQGKIPPSARDILKALQRVNLLFNPKTMVRNVAGNVIFTGINNTKDVVRAGLDTGLSKVTGQRTATLPSLKTQLKGMGKGIKTTAEDFKLGIDTSGNTSQFELNTMRGNPFDYKGKNLAIKAISKPFKVADDLTRLGLRMGDTPFYQAAYDDAVRQQLKIKGITEATPEIKAFAENIAKERTFQDTSKFSEFFDGFRSVLNKANIKGFGVGDIVLPFTKTPANILKAGVEYSPLNVVNVVSDAVKLAKGNKEAQYKLVDNLAKTLTGSGLVGAGMMLAQSGMITGAAPKDKDAASFQRDQGILPYALKTGKDFASFDWAQPAAIPIAIGADMYNNFKHAKDPATAMVEALKGGAGTLLSQSMVQGLQKLFSTYSTDSSGLLDNLESAGYAGVLQLIPFNALTRQAAEIIDPVKRSTYDDATLDTKLINQAKNSIPLLRQTLPKKYTTTGEEVKSKNILDTLLNPSITGTTNNNSTKAEILRLYNKSNQNIQFPRVAASKLGDNVLTGKQRSEYQKILGTEVMAAFNREMGNGSYRNKSDEDKAAILEKILTKTNKTVKDKLLKSFNLPVPKKK